MSRGILIFIKGFYFIMKLNFKDKKFVIYILKGFKKIDIWRKLNSYRGRKYNEIE